MLSIDSDIEARATVRLTREAVVSLANFYQFEESPPFSPQSLGWSLRQTLGGDGFEIFRDLIWEHDAPAAFDESGNECGEKYIRHEWAMCARPLPANTDVALFDEMNRVRRLGWTPPTELQAIFDRLASDELTRQTAGERAQRDFDDREHAAWLASGEPDWQDNVLWMAPIATLAAELKSKVESALAVRSRQQLPLPNNTPRRGAGGLPMLSTQETIADLGLPILTGFLVAQTGAPHSDAPTLPEAMNGHPLLEPLNAAIGHVVAIAERRGALAAHVDVLAVLAAVHPETCKAVVARVRGLGCALPESRLSPAISRFEASVAREVRVGSGWRTNSKGEPDPQNADNVAVLLRFVDADLRFNVWRQRIEIRRAGGEWQAFTDAELNSLRSVASCAEYGYRPTKEFFRDMLGNLARQTSYDPVLDYIDSAKWDGVKRLDTWLLTCCGVPDDDYNKAIGRNVIGGIVKRARHPGCKHDEVMILIGKQGCGKSNLTKVLALRPEWHTDGVTFEGRPQDIVPQFHGKLVIELSELDGMHRRDVGSVKRIISTSTDNFTAKYEAYSTDFDRRFIFIGTCNLESPLVDDSGNRRFYPVRVPDGVQINVEWLRENIEQLIAEAATLETAGDTFAIPAAVWGAAAVVQETARGLSAVEELLLQWFAKPTAPGSAGLYVLSGDIVSALTMARQNANAKVGSVMKRLGYVHTRPYQNGVQVRAWVKSPDGEITNCVRLIPAQRTPGGVVEMRFPTAAP
jgi:hypothetical protein